MIFFEFKKNTLLLSHRKRRCLLLTVRKPDSHSGNKGSIPLGSTTNLRRLMDVNLLSQILRELILDNDRVSLPGMGSFIADIAPAYFSKDGKTINPPFRRIFFRTSEIWNDELIEKYYIEKYNLDPESAKKELQEFFDKFRFELNVKKIIDLPEFGKIRSTKEGNVFFVAEKGLDIYSNAYGLEPIPIKLLSEEPEIENENQVIDLTDDSSDFDSNENADSAPDEITEEDREENREEVTPENTIEVGPESDSEINIEPEALNQQPETPETDSEPEEEEDPAIMKRRKNIIIILSIIVAILVLVIMFLIFKEPIANALEKSLYTPEELELINKQL